MSTTITDPHTLEHVELDEPILRREPQCECPGCPGEKATHNSVPNRCTCSRLIGLHCLTEELMVGHTWWVCGICDTDLGCGIFTEVVELIEL